MTLRLQVRDRPGATVVTVTGVADERVLRLVREAVVRASMKAELVVLELDQLTLVDVSRLRELLISINEGPSGPSEREMQAPRRAALRLVARRTSATALLVRWRIHHMVPVHRTVEDAVTVHRVMRGRIH